MLTAVGVLFLIGFLSSMSKRSNEKTPPPRPAAVATAPTGTSQAPQVVPSPADHAVTTGDASTAPQAAATTATDVAASPTPQVPDSTQLSATPAPTPGDAADAALAPQPTAPLVPAAPPSAVSATAADITRAYSANEIAADAKYKGVPLQVSGRVERVATDYAGAPYVMLEGDSLISVRCLLAAAGAGEAQRLQAGATVEVIGVGDGKDIFSIDLRDCALSAATVASLPRVVAATATAPTGITGAAAGDVVRVSAEDFIRAYQTNELSADAQYKDQMLEITGTVGLITKDYREQPYVQVKGDNLFSSVDCYVTGGDVAKVSALTRGQSITVRAIGDGISITDPKVRECRLL